MQKNALFCTFFAQKFGQFKKKQYLCTRFRKMTPKMANRKQVKIEKAEVLCESNKSLLLQFDEAKPTAIFQRKIAEIAQLVEHDLAKVGVAGSSPVFRSRFF